MSRLLAVLTTLSVVLGLGVAAYAEELPPTQVTLEGPASARMLTTVALTITLTSAADGTPRGGEAVQVERAADGAWEPVGPAVTTSSDGVAKAPVRITSTTNQFRAVYGGSESHAGSVSIAVTITGTRHPTTLVIGGSTQVVDERRAVVTATWRTDKGWPVPGVLRLYARPAGGTWRLQQSAQAGSDGLHRFTVRPRVDTVYRLRGAPGPWWITAVSTDRFVNNLPPAAPWRAPSAAPRPRGLALQPRGFGTGANPRVYRIPDNVWNHMTGISWRRGCPVGRSGLRLVRTNYWGFDGYRHRGELVVNARIAGKYVGALRDLYAARLPMRTMYRVDRFGYSSVSGGGDDYASMDHDNTSAFNCRWVSGNPGVRSPHSWGRSWDLNPWENPYRSNWGWLPNSWWVSRSDARVAWRSGGHRVVEILRANGFRWTYGNGDSQHFDGRYAAKGGGFFSG